MSLGIGSFAAIAALWGGVILHNQEVANLANVDDASSYMKGLKFGFNRMLATADEDIVSLLTLAGVFVASAVLMSVPKVGPYLCLAVGIAAFVDYFRVRKLKKSLKAS